MSEDKTQKAIAHGVAAQALLDDETLQAAFIALEADFVSSWRSGMTVVEREAAWVQLQGLDNFRKKLHNFVSNGKIAQAGLADN